MPSSSEKLQADQSSAEPFVTVWFVTKLGTRYEMPDMLPYHVDAVCQQLDGDFDSIAAHNVSDAVLMLPKRIIAAAGSGERCFWGSI